MFPPATVAKRPQINAVVEEVLREFSPSVKYIRYDIAQDWTGEWALFFRVLLSDKASERRNLRRVAPRVMDRMMGKLDLPKLGLYPYFDFRSESEQAALNEPAWAGAMSFPDDLLQAGRITWPTRNGRILSRPASVVQSPRPTMPCFTSSSTKP
jgi:hypothetical protein